MSITCGDIRYRPRRRPLADERLRSRRRCRRAARSVVARQHPGRVSGRAFQQVIELFETRVPPATTVRSAASASVRRSCKASPAAMLTGWESGVAVRVCQRDVAPGEPDASCRCRRSRWSVSAPGAGRHSIPTCSRNARPVSHSRSASERPSTWSSQWRAAA